MHLDGFPPAAASSHSSSNHYSGAPQLLPYTADEARETVLFEALICEVHAAALQTAVVTSAANALTDSNVLLSPAAIEPHVPRDTAALKGLRSHLVEHGVSSDDLVFVDHFLSILPEGQEALDAYFVDSAVIGHDRAAVLHGRTLAAAWLGVAHLAYLAIRELGVPMYRKLPASYGETGRELLALLESAKNGGRPCIDAYGRLVLPQMPQQRRTPRRMLCQDCILRHRDVRAPAFAKDISAGGIGLERAPRLETGEYLIVELPSGRTFSGVVAWSRGTAAGLRFSSPLSHSDPLLDGR